MPDKAPTIQRLSREELQPLMQKRDAPGLLRLTVQLGLFVAAVVVAIYGTSPLLRWTGPRRSAEAGIRLAAILSVGSGVVAGAR